MHGKVKEKKNVNEDDRRNIFEEDLGRKVR